MVETEMIIDQFIYRYSEKPNQETALRDAIIYSELQIKPLAYGSDPDPEIGKERIAKFQVAEHEAFLGNTDKLSKLILEDGTTLVTKELPTKRETTVGWALVNLASSIRRPR